MIKYIPEEPALKAGQWLVVADTHIGIEYEYFRAGIKLPSQLVHTKERLEKLIQKTRAKKLMILGDIKHKVPGISRQEEREVPELLHKLADKMEVHITPGNHDGDLKTLLNHRNVTIHKSTGFKDGDFFFCHGHAWPAKQALKAKHIFIGHNHPQIELRDRLGYRYTEPCWAHIPLSPTRLKEHYKTVPKDLPELVIVPAFNPLSGGYSLNSKIENGKRKGTRFHKKLFSIPTPEFKRFLGPIIKCARSKEAEITLLDGTFLGKLKNLF